MKTYTEFITEGKKSIKLNGVTKKIGDYVEYTSDKVARRGAANMDGGNIVSIETKGFLIISTPWGNIRLHKDKDKVRPVSDYSYDSYDDDDEYDD